MDPESVNTPKINLNISPPLINSANPWATTKEDLQVLYDCPYTGAVTIRTSLLEPFPHDSSIHQYTFYSSSLATSAAKVNSDGRSEVVPGETSSLNTLGYSPISLSQYIEILKSLRLSSSEKIKPFIVSVTGSPKDIFACLLLLYEGQSLTNNLNLLMEINLSCPNIPDKPPPAYNFVYLHEYIDQVALALSLVSKTGKSIHVGIKTPPYTYSAQFEVLIKALEESIFREGCPISFITATNTLGSSLILNNENSPALGSANGSGIGGLAGDALHPIALGNVKTIRAMLDASSFAGVRRIAIIGVGGVKDAAGYKRMRSVGADVVGVGTALGREGVEIFSRITEGLSEDDLA